METSSTDEQCAPERLIDLVRTADPTALDRITRCYAQRLLSAGRRHCPSMSEAEDAVQDALLIASQQLPSFRGEGTLEGWLVRIVARACRRLGRGHKHDPSRHEPPDALSADERDGPEQRAAQLELGRLLETVLLDLDARDRAILILAELEDRSAAAVGEELGLSEGAVRTRLSRIRSRVRQRLAPLLTADDDSVSDV